MSKASGIAEQKRLDKLAFDSTNVNEGGRERGRSRKTADTCTLKTVIRLILRQVHCGSHGLKAVVHLSFVGL